MAEPTEVAIDGSSESSSPAESDGREVDASEEVHLRATFEDSKRNEGLGKHGCKHYRRRCRIRAPCCGEVSFCRHCHNEQQDEKVDDEHHYLPRHEVKQVICTLCETEQEVQQFCSNCGVCMGQYFCGTCKFFDDDTGKRQFHCEDCGICRVGGRERFFHCQQCGCCYTTSLRNKHRCIEKAMNHNCPVCFEYLFDSLQPTAVLDKCGHTLHSACLTKLYDHRQTFVSCPMCSKSVGDNSHIWAYFDSKVAEEPMPPEYQGKEVRVVCNDCDESSTVPFHFYGLKCGSCGSYNTRQ